MKKIYSKPTTSVVEMEQEELLCGSPDGGVMGFSYDPAQHSGDDDEDVL